MKRIELGTEWIGNWKPARTTEIADRACKGLLLRGGPSGVRTFYRWTDVRDDATGKLRRKRVKLGHWPSLSLNEAREAVNDARDAQRSDPGADLTVEQLAQAYQRDRLAAQEHGAARWNVIRTHILDAKPDPKRPAFGEWPARAVERSDLAALVRLAKVEHLVERPDGGRRGSRWQGGPGTARTVLADINSIFAHGVEVDLLRTNPAGMKAGTFGLQAAGRERYLDATEIAAMFGVLGLTDLLERPAELADTVRLGIAFQAYTPPRSQGIIGARWDEFDLDAGTWLIPPARQKVKNAAARAQLRAFAVPLAPTAVAILRRLRELAPDSPWVLPSPLDPSRPLSPKALVRSLRRLQSSGRLAFGARATVHDLRRTWRTMAGELGVPFEVAEACLGHKLGGVAGVYARGDMLARRREATELVGAALDRIRLGKAAAVVPLRERRA